MVAIIGWLFTNSAGSAVAAPHWVSIDRLPAFSDARSQLQVLVNLNGHAISNRFCVVGQQDGRYESAYVYWPTENKLILWEPIQDDAQAIVDSRRYLDLKRDVIANDTDSTSTYLLTRAEVGHILAACRTYGQIFVVERTQPDG
jgi:hypothetical protein